MGCELGPREGELTASNNDGNRGAKNSPLTYSEIFEKFFPYYLSIGMTPEQYWDGDVTLTKAYREAEEYRMTKRNNELWYQGIYFYSALQATIGQMFAKKGAKKPEYIKEPIAITRMEKEQREQEQLARERAEYEAMLEEMKDFARKFNASRHAKQKEIEANGERSND